MNAETEDMKLTTAEKFHVAGAWAAIIMMAVGAISIALSSVGYSLLDPIFPATPVRVAAAEQGDAAEQYNLGRVYDEGQGALRDYAAAAKWYHRAAEQGHAKAQYRLGLLYATYNYGEAEHAPSKHKVLAYHWFNLAALHGGWFTRDDALVALNRLQSRMIAMEIDEAQKLSREFKPKVEMP